jgi:hypothetical protein
VSNKRRPRSSELAENLEILALKGTAVIANSHLNHGRKFLG